MFYRSWMGRLLCVALTILCIAVWGTPQPQAQESTSRITRFWQFDADRIAISVYSPSMGREILVHVQHTAGGGERPTLYLLDGAEAEETQSGWSTLTTIHSLSRGLPVNVVLPVGGPHSYYSDWKRTDPVRGVMKWETFLTEELPPIVDERFAGSGVDAIAGVSMGGLGALTLAVRHPNRYRAVAAYSSCPHTTNPLNKLAIALDVARGGGVIDNMWGPVTDQAWAEHDPFSMAENLRGSAVYLSSASGLPGIHNDPVGDPVETLVGGAVEAGAFRCTAMLGERLAALGIDYTMNLSPTGTHGWEYWNDELRASWPLLMSSLQIP